MNVHVILKPALMAKVLCLGMISFSGCSTFKSAEEAAREVEIRDTKLGIVVNYLDQGKPDQAYNEARKLYREAPSDARAMNLMGLCHLALKQPKSAATMFRKALSVQEDPAYRLNLSSALLDQKAYRAALSTLLKLNEKNLTDYRFPERVSHNRAAAYLGLGKRKLAIKHFQAALRDNPAYYPTLMQLATLMEQQKDRVAASLLYARARDACLKCFEPVRVLARNELSSGSKQKALSMLEEYVKEDDIDPKDRDLAKSMISKISPTTR